MPQATAGVTDVLRNLNVVIDGRGYAGRAEEVTPPKLTIRTEDGEGTVETVLAANPGLEALGPVLPPGTRVTLPAIEPPTQVLDVVRLWS